MLGDTFPDVYLITKTSEHTLVSSGKMQPKTIIPLFPNLPPTQVPQIAHLGVLVLPPPRKPIIQN